MPKLTTGRLASITVLSVTAIFAVVGYLAYAQGWVQFKTPTAKSVDEQLQANEKKSDDEDGVTFICEAKYTMPINDLDGPTKKHTEMIAAGLDYKNMTGWYQGEFSISESRKGKLVMQGSKALVSRPAMFERFGVMVTSEQFTLDRATGEFLQSLSFKDGRKVEFIKGFCGKLTKAPF